MLVALGLVHEGEVHHWLLVVMTGWNLHGQGQCTPELQCQDRETPGEVNSHLIQLSPRIWKASVSGKGKQGTF